MLVTYRYIIDAVVKDKKTTNAIAYELNRQEMRTKQNNYWTSKTVRDILLDMTHLQYNDTTYGHIVIGKSKDEAHKKKKTSISLKFKKISSEHWRKFKGNRTCLKSTEEHKFIEVFLSRETKAPRKSTAKKIFPLTELLRCAICGHYLGFTERTDRKGLLSIKKCWFRDKFGEKCVNKSSSMNELISYINSEISRYIQDIEQDISSVDARVLEKITQSIKDYNTAIKTKERALEKEQLAYQKGIYDIDEYASVRNKLKEEYKQLEGKVKALELEYSLLKEKSSTEKLNMLNEYQNLMSNPLLTWEEQNVLYKTIIE